jgi:hypothetical protein
MKLWIFVMTAVSLGLTCRALADNYDALAAQGYRWVTVDGPFACTSEQDVQRITTEHTDATDLPSGGNCPVLLPHTWNYRSGDQGGSSSAYVGDTVGKHHYTSMDLHYISQQASG